MHAGALQTYFVLHAHTYDRDEKTTIIM